MQTPISARRVSNVDQHRNTRMNKSAILVNKWEMELAKELPRYVTGSQRNNKKTTINMNRGLVSQGIRARAIHKLLQTSIKKAFEVQQLLTKSELKIGQKKSKQISKPYPRKITNILYRHNIKNYNPYISVLGQLEETKLEEDEKDRIRKLCYIGIARNYFQVRKYYQMPQYSRVGILIRTYMVEVMRNILEQKMENEPFTVYIKINPTALSFNPYQRPKQLQEQITKKRYFEIIRGINSVIVDEYEKYKKGNFQFIHGNLTYSEAVVYALLSVFVVSMLIWTNGSNQNVLAYCTFAIILLLVLAGMAFSWKECNSSLDQVCAPQNINNKIEVRLRQYLKSINNESLTWKLGPDFYWIQIQNVKVRKRKSQQSPDNF